LHQGSKHIAADNTPADLVESTGEAIRTRGLSIGRSLIIAHSSSSVKGASKGERSCCCCMWKAARSKEKSLSSSEPNRFSLKSAPPPDSHLVRYIICPQLAA